MFVITGTTGNIGSKTADILLDAGEKVRVVGRNAAGLQRFVNRGAEAAVGNLMEGAFAVSAFKGAAAVFAMIPPDYTSSNFQSYQNVIGSSIVNAVRVAQVGHVVNLSSQGVDLPAGTGPILGLRDQEEWLNRLAGVNVLHLRCTYFMENLLMSIPVIREKGFAGSTLSGDLKIAMIATRDIAGVVAGQLVRRDFEGKTSRDLLGQRDVSLNEAFSVIGREIGMPDLKYVQFNDEDATVWMRGMGMSWDVIRLFSEMSHALNNGLIGFNRARNADNTTMTSIEDFARTFAEAFAASSFRKAA